MTSVVTVNIRYTPPGMTEADSIHLEFQAPPGARVELRLPAPAPAPEEAQASPGGGWRETARKIVTDVGPDVWLGMSVIRDRLDAAGIKIGRSTLSKVLGEMAGRGDIARRGTGPQTEYGAPRPPGPSR